MSRKVQQNAKSSPLTGGKTSAIDFAASGEQVKHHGAPHTETKQRRSNRSTLTQTSADGDSDGSASETASDGGDGAQSDGAEADDEEGNDEDPDVHASSDINFGSGKGQAGLDQDAKLPGPQKEDFSEHTTSTSRRDVGSNSSSKIVAFTSSLKDDITTDDEDYDGVDLISESGDEEPAVEHLEEKAIIDSEEDNVGHALPLSPPTSPHFSLSSADFRIADLEDNPWLTEDPFFAEQINLLNPDDLMNNTDHYGNDTSIDFVTGLEEVPRRRVRFAEPLMLPSETEETAYVKSNDVTVLPSQINALASDKDGLISAKSNTGSGAGSHQGDETAFEGFESADIDDAESSVGSSSGYETDQGETTDEEDVPASATTRPSALLRHSSSEFNNRLAGQPLPKAPTSKLPPGHRWGPTLGSWVADPTKPIAVVASSGKQLIVYPAQRPMSSSSKVFPTIASCGKSSLQTSPHTSVPHLAAPFCPTAMDDSEMERSEVSSQGTATPMLSASPNLMMSGLGLGSGNLLSGHALGPPEAFFPFHSIGADGKMVHDELDADEDDDDDDGEDLLNIEDFIDFGEDSEDSDHDNGSNTESFQSPKVLSDQTDADATPTASPSARSSPPNLYEHLNRGKVTAFRRNQYDHGASIYRPSSSSAFQIPNAIKSNAFVAASSFGSLKKRKLSEDFGPSVANSPAFAKRRIVDPN